MCLIPVFLFKLPMASDVKTITLGVLSYYKPGAGGRRAVEFPGQHRRTAEKMDKTFGHLDEQGPVSRKLREYGELLPICFGKFTKFEGV